MLAQLAIISSRLARGKGEMLPPLHEVRRHLHIVILYATAAALGGADYSVQRPCAPAHRTRRRDIVDGRVMSHVYGRQERVSDRDNQNR